MKSEYKFQEGDLIEWSDNLFIVMENYGKTGEVTPLGKRFPITDFQRISNLNLFARLPTEN